MTYSKSLQIKIFDNEIQYGLVSKIFHWLRVLFLIMIYFATFSNNYLPINLFQYHKVIGVVFFIIICLNILWKIFNVHPNGSATSVLEKNIRNVIQGLLYSLMLLIPILGVIGHYNFGNELMSHLYDNISFLSFLENILFLDPQALRTIMGTIHRLVAQYLLPALIFLHIIVIIYNQFIRKNHEVQKMM